MLWDAILPDALDWTVEKRPIYRRDGCTIPNKVEIIRSDTEAHLGIVGSNYEPMQNTECVEFLHTIPGAQVEKAGVFGAGCKVWWAVRLPGELYIGGDVLYKYSIMVNAHDGSLGFRWFITPIRPSCANMMNMLIRSAMDFNICARHTRNIKSRVSEAQRVFGRVTTVYDELQATYNRLIRTEFSRFDLPHYVVSVLRPTEEGGKYRNAFARIQENFDTEEYANTQWGALNSVTKYLDHQRPMRGVAQEERRLANAIFGTTSIMKQRAFDMLQEGPSGPTYVHYTSNGVKGSNATESGEEDGSLFD